jgi:alanine racemase
MPVKAGAYGHGAVAVARAALAAGVRYLAAASLEEGAELRQAGINAPILLLSQASPGDLPEAASLGLIPLVSDREFVSAAASAAGAAAGKRLAVHLKIDTGMGRLGCTPEEAPELAAFIASKPSLQYAGTATHLAAAGSAAEGDLRYTRDQLARFRAAVEAIRRAGVDPGIVHAANSGGVLLHEDSWLDMVRPGLLLYGYSPLGSPPGRPEPQEPRPEPLMELVTNIVALKHLRRGEPVSYDRIWTAPEDTTIAVIPVGYGDGLPRALSGRLQVLVQGRLYPQVGRICMDQCMLNLGPDAAIPRWERLTVFGGAAPDAADLAAQTGTIPYEITCGISPRVPRVYC